VAYNLQTIPLPHNLDIPARRGGESVALTEESALVSADEASRILARAKGKPSSHIATLLTTDRMHPYYLCTYVSRLVYTLPGVSIHRDKQEKQNSPVSVLDLVDPGTRRKPGLLAGHRPKLHRLVVLVVYVYRDRIV
jgi:hypothetical protein